MRKLAEWDPEKNPKAHGFRAVPLNWGRHPLPLCAGTAKVISDGQMGSLFPQLKLTHRNRPLPQRRARDPTAFWMRTSEPSIGGYLDSDPDTNIPLNLLGPVGG